MLILNTGGTFNKIYNKLNGELEVPYNNSAIDEILENYSLEYDIAGVVYKDSLDMDAHDRKILADIIMESDDDTFIMIHGTDTMHITAEFLNEIFDDRKIILVGAMKPFSIDKIEASFNLGMALGFANNNQENGVFICMNGYVKLWNQLNKNRTLGKFELV
jgi:L-asparaginase